MIRRSEWITIGGGGVLDTRDMSGRKVGPAEAAGLQWEVEAIKRHSRS